MTVKQIRSELVKVLERQRVAVESMDRSNPSVTRLVTCAEDMAEITEAIIKYIDGDNVTIKLFQ